MVRSEVTGFIINVHKYANTSAAIKLLTPQGIYTIFGRGYCREKSKNRLLTTQMIKVKIYGTIKDQQIVVSDYEILDYNFDNVVNYEYMQAMVKYVKVLQELLLEKNLMAIYQVFEYVYENVLSSPEICELIFLEAIKQKVIPLEVELSCVNCKSNENIVTYSAANNGFLCNDCHNDEVIYPLVELQEIYKLQSGYLKKRNYQEKYLKKYYNSSIVILREYYGMRLEKWRQYE